MSDVTIRWDAKRVTREIADEVEATLEVAGKVVEVDARRRMLAIREPERGRGYRRVLALYRLTSAVVRTSWEIAAEIGIPKGEAGGDYGFWIEVGSRTAPAHPWLRPALLTNLKAILGLFGKG